MTAPGPFRGTSFPVGTDTTILSLLEFASGAVVSFGTSWDVHRHSNHPIEIHGTAGSLRLPDPDTFGGTVSLSAAGRHWADHASEAALYGAPNWPYDAPDRANYRMLGVADLVRALAGGRAPRASGGLALHVLEVMEAIMQAADGGAAVAVPGGVERPPLSARKKPGASDNDHEDRLPDLYLGDARGPLHRRPRRPARRHRRRRLRGHRDHRHDDRRLCRASGGLRRGARGPRPRPRRLRHRLAQRLHGSRRRCRGRPRGRPALGRLRRRLPRGDRVDGLGDRRRRRPARRQVRRRRRIYSARRRDRPGRRRRFRRPPELAPQHAALRPRRL